MMLRASVESSGGSVDLNAIVNPSLDSGVDSGGLLSEFAEALVTRAESLPRLRDRIVAELGETALIEAAGTAANFQRMVRIADGIGIPIDKGMAERSDDVRAQLGLEAFGSAANTMRAQVDVD